MVLNLLFIYLISWIINCINLCDFLQLCKKYVGVICTKGKREHMWIHIMSLVMIIWNFVFQTQVDHKIKYTINVFLSRRLWFFMKLFWSKVFYLWIYTFIFLFHCGLHSLKVLHKKWCSSHYVCIMWKDTI
jgi:hypothetical protein